MKSRSLFVNIALLGSVVFTISGLFVMVLSGILPSINLTFIGDLFLFGLGELNLYVWTMVFLLYGTIISLIINILIIVARKSYFSFLHVVFVVPIVFLDIILLSLCYQLQSAGELVVSEAIIIAVTSILAIVSAVFINLSLIFATKVYAKTLNYTNKFFRFFSAYFPGRMAEKTDGLINFADYKKPSYKILYLVMIVAIVSVALTALLPIGWLLLTSLKDPQEIFQLPYKLFPAVWDFGKIIRVWNELEFHKYLLNTLLVCAGSVVFAVIANGLLAYGVSIVKPPGYKVAFYLIMLSYMIPGILSITPLFQTLSTFGLMNELGFIPLWLVFGANAYYFILFKTYFDSIPKSLIEAAKVDGAGHWRIFFQQIIPLSMPIISVVAIFAMTASWSDFILPYTLLRTDETYTIMVKIFVLQANAASSASISTDQLLMLLIISMIPQIIIFLIFQKKIINGNMSSGLKE